MKSRFYTIILTFLLLGLGGFTLPQVHGGNHCVKNKAGIKIAHVPSGQHLKCHKSNRFSAVPQDLEAADESLDSDKIHSPIRIARLSRENKFLLKRTSIALRQAQVRNPKFHFKTNYLAVKGSFLI